MSKSLKNTRIETQSRTPMPARLTEYSVRSKHKQLASLNFYLNAYYQTNRAFGGRNTEYLHFNSQPSCQQKPATHIDPIGN